jgi:putative transposase
VTSWALWAGDGGEGARYWLHVLTESKNRGVADVCIVVCDGLQGLPDAISAVWPAAVTQTCIVHLLRNSFRYASRRDWAQLAKDLRPISTAPTQAAALEALASFAASWEARYPPSCACGSRLGRVRPLPWLRRRDPQRDRHHQRHLGSLNARFRRSVKARGHFPGEQAALKHLYLVIISLDPTGRGRRRWTNRWKAALNAFDIAFDGRVSAGRT